MRIWGILIVVSTTLFCLVLAKSASKMGPQKIRDGLVAEGPTFTLDGKNIGVYSGAMHYFRVPREYWMDRLMKLKACGLNTVETYTAWNLHEPQPGVFDFSGNLDVVAYIQMAGSLGLNVIFRPGPYICGEWEWGGHPYWLLKDPQMKVRTNYPGYQAAVRRFFGKLIPMVAPLQYQYGGSIVAVQVENEYGAYGSDKNYLQWISDELTSNGIIELLFTSDGGVWLEEGNLPGTLKVINFQPDAAGELDKLASFQPNRPLMVGEFWSGWFDHWGENHHLLTPSDYQCLMETILSRGASFNLYMFHGGTSFGFMNGANRLYNYTFPIYGSDKNVNPFLFPDTTSYDYDAPLSESGALTAKYFITQKLMLQYNPDFVLTEELKKITGQDKPGVTNEMLLAQPKLLPAPGPVAVQSYMPLTSILSKMTSTPITLNPHATNQQLTMEFFNQAYGFIVYRITLPSNAGGSFLMSASVTDSLVAIVGGKTVFTGRPTFEFDQMQININIPASVTDVILMVENVGRANYDLYPMTLDTERKGISNPKIIFNGKTITQLNVYNLDFNMNFVNNLAVENTWSTFDRSQPPTQPSLYLMKFDSLSSDVYVDIRGWNKGQVFINGFNLGRYVDLGPQKSLYLPAPYMKNNDKNQLLIFEQGALFPSATLVSYPDYDTECVMPCHIFGDAPYCGSKTP